MRLLVCAATAGGLFAAPASADIGRLFFTPAERAALEALRHAEDAPPPPPVVEPEPSVTLEVVAPPAPGLPVTVDGFVQRGHGRAMYWVNGENSHDGDLAASLDGGRRVQLRGNRLRLQPRGTEAPVSIKPGQTYDPNTGTLIDAYEVPVPLSADIAP